MTDIRQLFIKYDGKILDKNIMLPCPCCSGKAKYFKGETVSFIAGKLCSNCLKKIQDEEKLK